MRGRRPARGVVVLALLGLALHVSGATEAAFAVSTGTPAMSLSSAPDWKPPIVSRAAVVKSEGGIPGWVRQGAQYRAVAAVADDPSSHPAAGVGTVTGGVDGLPDIALPVGASTVGGLAYTHQSALQTAPAYIPAGTYTGWVWATDLAVPAQTSADFPLTFTADSTAPTPTAVTIANGGAARRADAGDTVTFSWGEVVDPHSVVPGWTGDAMDVTVRITHSTATGGDVLTVWNATNAALLPLGQVTLGGDYVSTSMTFGAGGTRSRLSWAPAGTGFTVVLGSASSSSAASTSTTGATTTWTPTVTVYDRAGNRSPATAVVEPGTADRDF